LHRTPVNYAVVDDEVIALPVWQQSRLVSQHHRESAVEVWLPDGWWAASPKR
jgi:hypothetical protein